MQGKKKQVSYHAALPGKSSSRCICLCLSEDRSQYLHTNWAFVSNLLIKTKQNKKKNQTSAWPCSSSAWWETGFPTETFNQARNQYELILKRFNQEQFSLLCAFIPVQILNVKARFRRSIHHQDTWCNEEKRSSHQRVDEVKERNPTCLREIKKKRLQRQQWHFCVL